MPSGLRARFRALRHRVRESDVPKQLRARFLNPPAALAKVEDSLRQHYFSRNIWGDASVSADAWLSSEAGRSDLQDHLAGRLQSFRTKVIPWLDDAKSIANASILEIGCGTGASSLAFAEQGARVTAVDIDAPSLQVAQDRCAAYGVECEFLLANGDALAKLMTERRFDYVIFFACLEHMTLAERLRAMRDTWAKLAPQGLWVCVETPNRLWYSDDHTSRLPFFNWLPDDLAFEYTRFSPREPLRHSYRDNTDTAMLSFLRHGRGVSYHEFDIALGDAASLDVVSSLALWRRAHGWSALAQLVKPRVKRKYRYESLIAGLRPDLHRGFFQPYLDLIIRKS